MKFAYLRLRYLELTVKVDILNTLLASEAASVFVEASWHCIRCVISRDHTGGLTDGTCQARGDQRRWSDYHNRPLHHWPGGWQADHITDLVPRLSGTFLRKQPFSPRSSPVRTFRAEKRLRLSDRNSILMMIMMIIGKLMSYPSWVTAASRRVVSCKILNFPNLAGKINGKFKILQLTRVNSPPLTQHF